MLYKVWKVLFFKIAINEWIESYLPGFKYISYLFQLLKVMKVNAFKIK